MPGKIEMLGKNGDKVMEEREVPGCKAEVAISAGGRSRNYDSISTFDER